MASREPDSSLELLLDTMCNTFGGVMFIAISLVVVMSMLSSVKDSAVFQNKTDPAVLQQNLDAMRLELKKLSENSAVMEKILKEMENDPRRELMKELLVQEQLEKKLALERKILVQQQRIAETRLTDAVRKQEDVKLKIADLEISSRKLDAEVKKLQDEVKVVRENVKNTHQKKITFRLMESNKKAPYFLLVSKNRVWRVGPLQNLALGRYVPSEDCLFREKKEKDKVIVSCIPDDKKPGIPILAGNQVSAEILALLSSIPRDRVPQFSLDKESMRAFCILREYLKQNRILHGVDTEYHRKKTLDYVLTNTAVNYEY